MKNASKSMENENTNIAPTKKAYVKPTVVKHAAATQIVGSTTSCGIYVATFADGGYYH
jgi:hypothetical protein